MYGNDFQVKREVSKLIASSRMLTFELSSYHDDPEKFLSVEKVELCGKVVDDFDNFCNESGRNDEIFDLENAEPKESNETTIDDAKLSEPCKTMAKDIENMKGNPGALSKKISSQFSKISAQQG